MLIFDNNIDPDNIDWVALANQLGLYVPGQTVELTKIGTQYDIWVTSMTYTSELLQNPNIPIDYIEDQLDYAKDNGDITSFDKACIMLYTRRLIREEPQLLQ